MIALDGYTFLDLGASNGGSIQWASGALGGKGFGVDIDPKKIEGLKSRGFDGHVMDAASLSLPDSSVPFVTMINFLEHLPNKETAERIITSAFRVAKDFLFVLGPDFEGAHYLRSKGFKKYFADWSGHTWHHRTHEFDQIAGRLGANSYIVQHSRIYDSNDRAIAPLSSSRNRGPYDPAIDPAKPFVNFDEKVYQTIMMVIAKSDRFSVADILIRAMGMHITRGKDAFNPLYSSP